MDVSSSIVRYIFINIKFVINVLNMGVCLPHWCCSEATTHLGNIAPVASTHTHTPARMPTHACTHAHTCLHAHTQTGQCVCRYLCTVHLFYNRPEKVSDIVADMLGNKLITKQTPKGGVKVNTVSVSSVEIRER